MSEVRAPLLELRGIRKHFGAVEILPQILAWLKVGFLDSAAWRAQFAAANRPPDPSGRMWIDDPVQMPPFP